MVGGGVVVVGLSWFSGGVEVDMSQLGGFGWLGSHFRARLELASGKVLSHSLCR